MSARPVLLLTRDDEFEKLLKEAFLESAATILVARSVDDALQIVCTRGAELDLAVIDRDDCHGINLLSAINACQHKLPIVVVAADEPFHSSALAHPNRAAACFLKPIPAAEP